MLKTDFIKKIPISSLRNPKPDLIEKFPMSCSRNPKPDLIEKFPTRNSNIPKPDLIETHPRINSFKVIDYNHEIPKGFGDFDEKGLRRSETVPLKNFFPWVNKKIPDEKIFFSYDA